MLISILTKNLKISDEFILTQNEWHFIGFSFDGELKTVTIFVNEGHTINKTSITCFSWIDKIFNGKETYLGGVPGSNPSEISGYDGNFACVQIFDYAMNTASMNLKKYCPDLAEKAEKCPPGYRFFDRKCYSVNPTPMSFSQAEVACLPDKTSSYESSLAFSENSEHWDFMAFIAMEEAGSSTIWGGVSDFDLDEIYDSR